MGEKIRGAANMGRNLICASFARFTVVYCHQSVSPARGYVIIDRLAAATSGYSTTGRYPSICFSSFKRQRCKDGLCHEWFGHIH